MRERLAAALAALCLMAARADAQAPSGRVVHVASGDALTVLVDGRRVRVRVAGIDSPELDQAHGTAARRALARLSFDREAELHDLRADGEGGYRAALLIGGVDVAAAMIRAGHGWVSPRGAASDRLTELEREARTARRGLWAGTAVIPPWDWRRGTRSIERPAAPPL